jgi:3-hydroxy-9,10-secoandrosta-1,3,5(10)-triene-9,17-dione monooxygenase
MMILGVHQWEFGHMSQQAGDEVWGQDDSVRIASSYAPWGTLTPVEGGYVLDGTWHTSSGCDHADWAFVGGLGKDEDGVPNDRLACLVPRSDYRIVDDWHVFGLCGTGSKSLVLDKVFVPSHRVHSTQSYTVTDRGDMYMFPFGQIFCGSVSAVICGFAQGAIDIFTEQLKVRRNVGGLIATNTSPYVKDRLGNAVVRVRSARARLFQVMAETTPYALKRELVPVENRMEQMLDIARVGRDCEEAALLLYKATAARGVYLSNPLQRVVRDIMVASNHITQNADDSAGVLGGFMLGAELPPSSYGIRRS